MAIFSQQRYDFCEEHRSLGLSRFTQAGHSFRLEVERGAVARGRLHLLCLGVKRLSNPKGFLGNIPGCCMVALLRRYTVVSTF